MNTERSYNLFEKYVFIPVYLIYTPKASYKYVSLTLSLLRYSSHVKSSVTGSRWDYKYVTKHALLKPS